MSCTSPANSLGSIESGASLPFVIRFDNTGNSLEAPLKVNRLFEQQVMLTQQLSEPGVEVSVSQILPRVTVVVSVVMGVRVWRAITEEDAVLRAAKWRWRMDSMSRAVSHCPG